MNASAATMKGMVSREIVLESLRGGEGYLYLNNAKAGCSTIKQALWRLARGAGADEAPDATALHGYPSVWTEAERLGDLSTRFRFSFVRNPYVRALSCYRDKILRPGQIRARFLAQHGFALDAEPDFETFLAAIVHTRPVDDDQHWRLQAANLLVASIDLDWVGRLERFSEDFSAVANRLGIDFAVETRRPHATGAAEEAAKVITPRARDLIEEKYALDFELFGYARDLDRLTEAAEAGPLRISTFAGRRFLDGLMGGGEKAYLECIAAQAGADAQAYAGLVAVTTDRMARNAYLQAGLNRWPRDETLLRLQIQTLNGEPAINAARRLCRIAPHRAAHWMLLAQLQEKAGEPQRALANYRKAVHLKPRWREALVATADLAEALGRKRLAADLRVRAR